MATRRKPAPDPWVTGEPVTMSNGMQVIRWENSDTGEVRLVPAGLHPDDQPLNDQPMPLVATAAAVDPDIEETATDRVSAMLAQAQGADRAEVNVYRMVNGAREYCRKFRPDEFEDGSFDMLREMFGPGEYELRLYSTDPVTRKFSVRNLTRIKISDIKQAPAVRAELPSGLSQVLTAIAQGQDRMLTALVEMKQAPQRDPMEEMGKMLTMMTAMRSAMGLDQVQQQSNKSSIGEIVAAIRELRGAAEEIAPPEREEPASLMGMLPQVLDLVKAGQQSQAPAQVMPEYSPAPEPVLSPVTLPPSMMEMAQAPQAPINSASTMPAFARNLPPAAPAAHTDDTEDDSMNPITLIKLRAYLKTLVAMAVKPEPVQAGAQFVYDKLPDDFIDLMELPNWFEMLQSVAPEVMPHRVWLTNVRDAALKMIENDQEEPSN
jgi:hypothetical protein